MIGRAARRLVRLTRDALEDNQWLLPLIGCLLGLVLAAVFALRGQDPDPSTWTITVDGARNLLMGWLSIVFAALSIVLALASVTAQNVVGRYSSRVLRLYFRLSADRLMIATFGMTAAYVLSAQYQLRSYPTDDLVPTGTVYVSFALLILTGVTIIWYVSRIGTWFRADQTSRRITNAIRRASRAEARSRRGDKALPVEPVPIPPSAEPIAASQSGYLAGADTAGLADLARLLDTEIVLERHLGTAVVRGERIGWVGPIREDLPVSGARGADEMLDIVEYPVLDVAVEFGLVALVDIAIMALSPAVNDPNTAVRVLEEMSFLFVDLADAEAGAYGRVDPDGRLRVRVASSTFGERVELALRQIILYGSSDPAVRGAIDRVIDQLLRLDLSEHDREIVEGLARSETP